MKKFLFTALFAIVGVLAFSQERIAVFPFEDMNNILTRTESVMFYQEFGNEFRNRSPNNVSIVPRQDVERLINVEMAFQLGEFSAREKTAEMNRVLNGTQILSGRIARVDNEIRITVSLFTYPELDWLPGGVSRSVSSTSQLFRIIPELVQSMQDIIVGGGGATQSAARDFLYEIVDGRTVTITGYLGEAAVLNIPSQIDGLLVTAIGDHAFYNCNSLTSVTIPSSVTEIGQFAFAYCSSLTNITIPSSVTSIGRYAFQYTEFTSITIPSSVIFIDFTAFNNCGGLTSITVDNRNPVYADINGILFDKNIRTLIRYPEGRNQRTYVIPSSVTSIGNGAFYNCNSLTSVTIPSSVTEIGQFAFAYCSSLTNITIPSSVTEIGDYAFEWCTSLTNVIIPSSVTSIGHGAFSGCSSLTSITVETRNSNYASVDGVLFDKNIQTIIKYPEGRNQRTYVIPSSVMYIGWTAFQASRNLTNVTIPSSVEYIDVAAFYLCSSLTSVTIPSSVITIEDWAFRYCSSLTSVAIPNSVTYIGEFAFGDCYSLTNIAIPSSVTSLGGYAFFGCDNLTNVTLSRRTQVGENAFPDSARITYWD